MNIIQKLRNHLQVILTICCIAQPLYSVEKPYHHIGFYIENFGGRVDPETLPHVYEVFTKVRATAEINDRNLPQLVVIKNLPGPPAFVLPDGNLVLAQKALDVIYKDIPLWEGNTRLAFVIGHELAHLASDDFWSAEIEHLIHSKAFSGEMDRALLEPIEQDSADLMERELKADDKGFLYAAIAGFPVEVLLEQENDFLSYWVDCTNTQSSTSHPEAFHRTELLRVRLQQKKDALEFFFMGMRLAHFGRYQDAIYFFREFQDAFPGREVFNNLGVCYLQMALKNMPPALAYQYWLPGILDNNTAINRTTLLPIFRDRTRIKIAEDFLHKAVRYLATATEKDPAYTIGYINLASAYFYLNEMYKARAAIEEARLLQPDDYTIESLRALILLKEGQPMDTWSYAEEIFSALASHHPTDTAPLSIYYNWARLLEERGRSAENQWKKLDARKNELPWPIAHMMCERLKDPAAIEDCLTQMHHSETSTGATLPKPLPIQPGFESWQSEATEHPLREWQELAFHWHATTANSGIIYHRPQGDVVLEMDGVVEMVVLDQKAESSEQWLQECGEPHYKRPIINGELWSYGHWATLVEDNQAKEVWVVREQR